MPCWTDVWGGKGQRGKWRDLKKETDRLADGGEDGRAEEGRRGEFILMMVQTSGIKHLELKYQPCNYTKTLLLHLVFYSSVWKFPSDLKSETWRSFSRRSFVAVNWSTDVVSMRINRQIPPQHHYKETPACSVMTCAALFLPPECWEPGNYGRSALLSVEKKKKKKKEAIVVSITRGRKSTFGELIHAPRSRSVGDLFEGRTQ